MTRLIVLIFIAMFLQNVIAQLVGPTVTPATTATNNELGSSTTLTPDLTRTSSNGSIPTSSSKQTIVIVSGCGNSCIKTSTGYQAPTASESAQIQANDLSADNRNKNVIIIACSVVAGVLLILISFLICFFYRRKRQRENSSDYNKPISKVEKIISHRNTKEDEAIKTYNISSREIHRTSNDNDDNDEKITPPVVMYTDVMRQSEQQNGKGSARLSKYNFLAHMFTQMKESYSLGAMVLAQDSANDRIEQKHPENNNSVQLYQHHDLEKNSVRNRSDQDSQLNAYQMNHFYPINQDGSTTPSTPLPESGRESTTTVGTLHAPLFKNNGLYPPRRKSPNKQSNDPLNNNSKQDALGQNNTRVVESAGGSRPYNFF